MSAPSEVVAGARGGEPQAPILSASGLHHAYGATQVLKGVDFQIDAGERVAIMGPSGSGKSTLLHLLAGLLVPEGGSVHLGRRRLDDLPERNRARLRLHKMGFVFQFGDLVPELTLVENVELPARLTGSSPKRARQQAMTVLERLGVAEHAGKRISAVSGGQAQRAAVARALVHRPAVILADEPTGSLDTVTSELVLEALVDTAKDQGTAVVLVTHDLGVASWAQRAVTLRDGQQVSQ